MNHWRRKGMNILVIGLCSAAALIALVPLILIFVHLISKGFGSLNLAFFTDLPRPVGEPGGGMANAILGSCVLIGIASLIGFPIGIFGGMYLSEFGKTKFGDTVRFSADMLSGTPSIVIGIFVYALIVLRTKNFSALAGGVALGIMMVPTIMRTTETMLDLVPRMLREGALALGIPYWKTLLAVVFKTARSGIVTGALLAIARVAGETAPLLFTALGNQFWSTSLNEPIAALPLQIFQYASSPFEVWQEQAWAGALVLIGLVFILNVTARIAFRRKG
ncbi:MAG: phosphate ABC transporter permease PstA [Deltaproteobacteria bacterium]|nr:phosphate ABC transporter permease PstA [Deltaproteobacteria bacterium]